jgi:hypothetical protein
MSAFGCGFNWSMQHVNLLILKGNRDRVFTLCFHNAGVGGSSPPIATIFKGDRLKINLSPFSSLVIVRIWG